MGPISHREVFMLSGLDNIRQLQTTLRQRATSPKLVLAEAGQLFWRACIDVDKWPARLRAQAALIIAKLFAHGPIADTGQGP